MSFAASAEFWQEMGDLQRRVLAAAPGPAKAERVKVCKLCHERYVGIRKVDAYERSDGMLIEHYVQRCCGKPTPFKNHYTEDGWRWGWVAVTTETAEEDSP